jgi:hypothetical protein
LPGRQFVQLLSIAAAGAIFQAFRVELAPPFAIT